MHKNRDDAVRNGPFLVVCVITKNGMWPFFFPFLVAESAENSIKYQNSVSLYN